jgi:hypothetical protein
MPFSRAEPAYDPAVLSMLQHAYDGACREMGIDPHPIDHSSDKETRETLARAIMDLAATGLRDPHVLRERALEVTKPTRPHAAHRAVRRLINLYERCRRSRNEGRRGGGTSGPPAVKL